MTTFFFLLLFISGSVIGSFLTVIIDRIPREEQVLSGRSHCDSCGHILTGFDLVPILSWFLIRGQCRYCHASLSFFYPFIEFVTGLSFVFIAWWRLSVSISGINIESLIDIGYWLFLASTFIVVFFADMRYHIIPDIVVLPSIALVFLYRIFQFLGGSESLINPLLASLGAAVPLLLIFIISKGKGMGLGDVKFVSLIGLLLGFPKIVAAIYIAFLTGAAAGTILILGRKRKLGEPVAFGPFLVIGSIVALFYGDQIIAFASTFLF